MPTPARLLTAAAVSLLAFAPAALAQCPAPDGLDGGACWGAASATLPEFTGAEQDALRITWRNCAVEDATGYRARWGRFRPAQRPTIPTLCSVYVARLELFETAGGSLAFTGALRVFYSRTWLETTEEGRELQVWRYLLNGDLAPRAGAGTPPVGIPPCEGAFGNKVQFTGYIDVARHCPSGPTLIAWSLNHDCDALSHVGGFPRGGSFHADRSYTIVGPAAGFVPSNALASESGSSSAEAIRPLDLISKVTGTPASGDICLFEEPMDSATVTPLGDFCPCPDSTAAVQYRQSSVDVRSLCGTVLVSAGGFPDGLVSKSIGSWTDSSSFPGAESLLSSVGGYRTIEPCRPRDEFQVFYGVTTRGGYEARTLGGGLLPRTFVDQGNALRFPDFTPVMNLKFVTDVIVNANLP